MKTLVFLHIPKTAGQTVHAEIERVIGPKKTSPVRVHTQAAPEDQFPPGYQFYSGHLDWTTLSATITDPFVFTVLRDPRERIASFYFYLLEKANALDKGALESPQNTGMKILKSRSADDYFFSGDISWQKFIHDHYDNFYCTYFAKRKMRGWTDIANMSPDGLVAQAVIGAQDISKIYTLESLSQLEDDLLSILGKPVQLAGNRNNAGPQPEGEKRWPKLLDQFESDKSSAQLENFVLRDLKLMNHLDLV